MPLFPRSLLLAALLVSGAATIARAQNTPARPANGGGSAPLPLDEVIKLLDKDGDGKISKEEATGDYANRFPRWDANGDGFATREEIQASRQRQGIGDDGRRLAAGANPARGGTAGAAAPAANDPRFDASKATMLTEPPDWRYESMPVPPPFAPDAKLRGTEEIRFSPGWGQAGSPEYFTYAVALKLDGASVTAADLEDFLTKYFVGLGKGRARRANATLDPATMKTQLAPVEGQANAFSGQTDFFDAKPGKLNVEAQLIPHPADNKTGIVLLFSPSPRDAEVWKPLREVGRKAAAKLQ